MDLARISEAVNFRHALDIYLKASGQCINDDKSSIYFFNTPQLIQSRIVRILRFQIGSLPLMYLGIPLALGAQRREYWQGILDKFRSKVSHWTYRWLSSAGRVILLKTVVQSLPIYRCCVQVPPSTFVREFDALSWQFLWSGNLLSLKWSLVKWESVCRPKHAGGLGLRSMALAITALAAKLYWRWCNNQDQDWAKILTHKYLPGADCLDVSRHPLQGKGSCIWDTLKKGAQLIKEVVACWKDPQEWPLGGSDEDRAILSRVLETRLCSSLNGRDVLAWNPSPKGKFTVAQGYAMLDRNLHGPAEVHWWKKKILIRLQETISAKCDMPENLDPSDLDIVRNVSLGDSSRRCFASRRPHLVHQRVYRDGRWMPPPVGVLKINTDGSSRGNPSHAGVGGIGRGNDGGVALDDVSWQLASVGRQILSLCSALDFVSFCHIPREWNKVADCLAKWASENVDGWDISGKDELPSNYLGTLERLLVEDMNR
ncbi:uncharacterized protein LOC131065696 [Cryptomeria japonica]|uniref:uncharacterized protein LOC131065696 n=1 Tax=Cryptomeria japonica TaxID=3369 RepID=UPI0025AD5971|nr:uncharacterized protein LOC131065696 [Cryptomeria japonica]